MIYNNEVKAIYIPGSEWLYYKIYSGTGVSERILISIILPLVEDLLKKGIIDSWFFIRYFDPDYHLRIRFHLNELKYLSVILSSLNDSLKPFVDKRLITNVQLDTYRREIDRYGSDTIDLSEKLFFFDSMYTVKSLSDLGKLENRYIFGVSRIITFFKTFNFDMDRSFLYTEKMRANYKKEFNANKQTIRILDKKYRDFKEDLERTIKLKYNYETEFINNAGNISKKILDYKKTGVLSVDTDDLLSSYIHMSLNRIFQNEQRFNEFICYEFTYKLLKTFKYKQ